MSLPATALDLRREHDNIERLAQLLLDSYQSGSWAQVEIHWNELEQALRAHMAREEEVILPSFRAANPVETDGLLQEHARLRTQLSTLGVNLELHAVPLGDVETLVEGNRAHSVREEGLLGTWLAARGKGAVDTFEDAASSRMPTSQDALSPIRGAHRHIFTG